MHKTIIPHLFQNPSLTFLLLQDKHKNLNKTLYYMAPGLSLSSTHFRLHIDHLPHVFGRVQFLYWKSFPAPDRTTLSHPSGVSSDITCPGKLSLCCPSHCLEHPPLLLSGLFSYGYQHKGKLLIHMCLALVFNIESSNDFMVSKGTVYS